MLFLKPSLKLNQKSIMSRLLQRNNTAKYPQKHYRNTVENLSNTVEYCQTAEKPPNTAKIWSNTTKYCQHTTKILNYNLVGCSKEPWAKLTAILELFKKKKKKTNSAGQTKTATLWVVQTNGSRRPSQTSASWNVHQIIKSSSNCKIKLTIFCHQSSNCNKVRIKCKSLIVTIILRKPKNISSSLSPSQS